MNKTSYLIKLNKLIKQRSFLREKLEGISGDDKNIIEKSIKDVNKEIKRINNAQIKQAIKDSIAHWERMIAYAQRQRASVCPSPREMLAALGEMWSSNDCPLCKLFSDGCRHCPLCDRYLYTCCTEWTDVAHADTWGEWVEAAHELLKLLKKIREKEGKKKCLIGSPILLLDG